MNDNDRLKLNDIIKMNDVEDVTSDIREKKHSLFIKEDVIKMPCSSHRTKFPFINNKIKYKVKKPKLCIKKYLI